jgi:NAD(P)-dependent dehydrogenase (short-subunit alcohol dehydrogenase family)
MSTSLSGKHALVFTASGAIGSEVARAFAREGASVWLSGRNAAALDDLAAGIRTDGGAATVDLVDAIDPAVVTAYVDRVTTTAGRIDAVFNGIGGRPADLGYPARATEQELALFLEPPRVILGSTFLTARAAGARMAEQRSGAIVTLSASLSDAAIPFMAGISATCGAIEAMSRSLAGEFGPSVRVNYIRATAMPETRTIRETGAGQARLRGLDPAATPPPGAATLLPLRIAETAAVAAFLASDAASGLSGRVVNVYGRVAA